MTVDSNKFDVVQCDVAAVVLDHVRCAVSEDLRGELCLDSSLHECGLDSLASMEVVNRIEETFGVRFSEDSLYAISTCRDLVRCVIHNGNRQGVEIALSSEFASSQSSLPAVSEIAVEYYDVTQFPECIAFQQRLAETAAAGFANPFFRVKQGVHSVTAKINDHQVISYTSFDYLGLAGHPRVIEAAQHAIREFGTSASASRLVGGESTILKDLDQEIARFLGTEAAIVVPSGYGTNASLLGHLFGADDLILYDELAHNSIVQGSLLSKAHRRPFPHHDFEFVDRLLNDVRGRHRRVVVAIEGIYSMDGDYPDLPRFIDVKRRHGALLYVDEAHSIGVMGANGRGICEHFGVNPSDGDLWMGTISKALASGGGYIAGRAALIQYLKYSTPAIVFATATSPANAAAALAAIRCIREEPQRVEQLRENAQLFLKLAQDCELDTGHSRDSPIVPIILRDSLRSIDVSHKLLARGIDAQPILYPAVAEAAARVRFFITANHTDEQICRTVEVLTECIAASKGSSGR
jgi:8-amino-7-oxononanoate synthase